MSEERRSAPEAEGLVALTVRVPAAVVRALRAAAAREGASAEAVAALWLAEHAEEIARNNEKPHG